MNQKTRFNRTKAECLQTSRSTSQFGFSSSVCGGIARAKPMPSHHQEMSGSRRTDACGPFRILSHSPQPTNVDYCIARSISTQSVRERAVDRFWWSQIVDVPGVAPGTAVRETVPRRLRRRCETLYRASAFGRSFRQPKSNQCQQSHAQRARRRYDTRLARSQCLCSDQRFGIPYRYLGD